VDVIIEQREIRPVVMCRKPTRRNRHPYAVAAALTERSRRGLDAGGQAEFRMPRGDAVDLPELPDVIEADGKLIGNGVSLHPMHACQMQYRVEQHRGVPRRE